MIVVDADVTALLDDLRCQIDRAAEREKHLRYELRVAQSNLAAARATIRPRRRWLDASVGFAVGWMVAVVVIAWRISA